MQWHVHKGKGGPLLVQYSLTDGQQLELWVSPPSIAEGAFIVNEVFNDREYLNHGVTLKPGDTVIDVGANIGVFGARALSLVPGGDLHYIGIEPCPQNFQLLQHNLLGTDGQGKQNSMFHINEQLGAPLQAEQAAGGRCCPVYPGNIQLLQSAVSSEQGAQQGTCSMTFYPFMPGNSTLRPQEKAQLQAGITQPKFLEGAQTLQLPVSTLTRLLAGTAAAGGPIALLKIDVEGEELEVLKGIDAATWARVQQVALEVHDCIDEPSAHSSSDPAAAQPAAAAAGLQPPASGQQPQQQQHAPRIQQQPQQQQADQAPSTQQPQQQQHQQPQQEGGQQQRNAALSTSAAAMAADGRFPRLQQILAGLPGPRTCRDIDGVHIRFHPLPVRVPGQLPVPELDPARAAALAEYTGPPPRDEGRVMVVAKMLRDLGFRVVIECPFGIPLNFTVYGLRRRDGRA